MHDYAFDWYMRTQSPVTRNRHADRQIDRQAGRQVGRRERNGQLACRSNPYATTILLTTYI